jgi:uncharacterized heparinase superfamily protein
MNETTRIADAERSVRDPVPSAVKRERRSAQNRLRRLSRMPWTEIAGRGRQEASKWFDRVTAVDRAIDAHRVLREHGPSLANPAAALDILRTSAPRRFFAGIENPAAIARRLPDHEMNLVCAASALIQNRFDLLGYRTLWFGDPIDWHLDPVSSRRAPRVHWTHLDPLDSAAIGDSKVVWELNRHQWLVRVAQAYALTGDERYAERCLSDVEAWLEANPPGIGINWSSSLEVSFRVMSWSWIVLLLRHSAALTGERLVQVLAAIRIHANHVARYLSYYFSPNTHLIGEALGLFYAGTVFQEFNDARRWRDLGARILIAESETQICPDGVHFERSTCYHRYTAEAYQQFLLLADRNGIDVPADVVDRLGRVVAFLLAIRQPDGFLPEVGDADGGCLSPIVERSQCDPRGVFGVAAAMLQCTDFAWASDGLPPEVLWFTGAEGARSYESLRPSIPTGAASQLFPTGGYAVMRSGWERDAHQMIVDVGPLGCPISSGHGHADLLSVQLTAFGESCVVDAGTYCYTAEPEWRNFFRGTTAHSTLMIDGRNQVQPEGPFSWHGRPHVTLHEWRSNAQSDFVDAQHDAYAPLTHRRRVLFVKPSYWVVIDDVTTNGMGSDPLTRNVRGSDPVWHQFDVQFQLAPIDVTVDRDAWVRGELRGGNSVWMAAFCSAPVRPIVKIGERGPIRGWISSDYGQRTPAPMLIYSCEAPLPWRCMTLVMPWRSSKSQHPAVAPLYDDQQLPIGLEIEDRLESIFVDESDVFVTTA